MLCACVCFICDQTNKQTRGACPLCCVCECPLSVCNDQRTPGRVRLHAAAEYFTEDLEVCRISDSPSFQILILHLAYVNT